MTQTNTRTLTHTETRTQTQTQTQTQVQTVTQTQTVTRTDTQTVTATETITVQSDPVTIVRTVTESSHRPAMAEAEASRRKKKSPGLPRLFCERGTGLEPATLSLGS